MESWIKWKCLTASNVVALTIALNRPLYSKLRTKIIYFFSVVYYMLCICEILLVSAFFFLSLIFRSIQLFVFFPRWSSKCVVSFNTFVLRLIISFYFTFSTLMLLVLYYNRLLATIFLLYIFYGFTFNWPSPPPSPYSSFSLVIPIR